MRTLQRRSSSYVKFHVCMNVQHAKDPTKTSQTNYVISFGFVNVGVYPSKVVIINFRLDKYRKSQLDHKAKGRAATDKNRVIKFTAMDDLRRALKKVPLRTTLLFRLSGKILL